MGVICRYYLYRRSGGASSNADIEALYEKQQSNPATLEIVGTFAPLFADERIVTGPVGRLLISNVAQIPTPPGSNNNGNGFIALAPAVLQRNGNTISADFSGTFPDDFQTDSGANPKFDFGPVSLWVANAAERVSSGRSTTPTPIPAIAAGGSSTSISRRMQRPGGSWRIPMRRFSLQHEQYGTILAETDYYFVSNQQGIYAEQHGARRLFPEPGDHRAGHRLGLPSRPRTDADDCPPITVWQYRSVPIQSPGDVEAIATNFKPGQQLQVDTSQPGNFLFTFSIDDPGHPAPAAFRRRTTTRS